MDRYAWRKRRRGHFAALRSDKAMQTQDPAAFNKWTDTLGASAGVDISQLSDFLDALRKRHDCFHQHGCRLSDHGLDYCYADACTEREAQNIFSKVRGGKNLTVEETSKL